MEKILKATARQIARGFRLIVTGNYETMSRLSANWIADEVRANPHLLLCAPTGSTPSRIYELLAEKKKREPRLFVRLRVLKLDEWGGLPRNHPATCETYLRHRLIEPLGISDDRYFTFRGDCREPQAECNRLRLMLQKQGPIDLCILGLGFNGHLGLNEPAGALQAGPHVAKLTKHSLRHSMLKQEKASVIYGLTVGMADILQSKKVFLVVSGQSKREPMRRLLSGRLTTNFPASFLWLHNETVCFCDRNAIAGVDMRSS